MSKKVIYICDVCGKETEKPLGSTDRVFNDDCTGDLLSNVFGVKLELKQTEDVANACICNDCFIEFIEAALEQMREHRKEHHQAETDPGLVKEAKVATEIKQAPLLKNEVVEESLGEKLLRLYYKRELKPKQKQNFINMVEAANKKLTKNSIPFEVFYLAGKTILQKEYAIATVASWVNNTPNCNSFVKKHPIVEFCKTMKDVRNWWNKFNKFLQENPKSNRKKKCL